MLPGLHPRLSRFMQNESLNSLPSESNAAQFALQMLNDLVASGDARSSVWNAQVELLAEFVQQDGRDPMKEQLDDLHRHVKDARARPHPLRLSPLALFMPMS
jgi:hypothetical protein